MRPAQHQVHMRAHEGSGHGRGDGASKVLIQDTDSPTICQVTIMLIPLQVIACKIYGASPIIDWKNISIMLSF